MSDSPAAPCRIPPSPDDGLSSVAVRRQGKRRYLVLWFDGVRVVAEGMWLKCVVAGRVVPLPVVILHPDCTLAGDGDVGRLGVPRWWAEQRGLCA